jgi:serine/threonine protein kinase HipA of HipAB toxin-antitoxin module
MRIRAPYTARLDFICPEKLAADVATAAALRMQSKNSWLRMAVIERLKQEQDVRVEDKRSTRPSAS